MPELTIETRHPSMVLQSVQLFWDHLHVSCVVQVFAAAPCIPSSIPSWWLFPGSLAGGGGGSNYMGTPIGVIWYTTSPAILTGKLKNRTLLPTKTNAKLLDCCVRIYRCLSTLSSLSQARSLVQYTDASAMLVLCRPIWCLSRPPPSRLGTNSVFFLMLWCHQWPHAFMITLPFHSLPVGFSFMQKVQRVQFQSTGGSRLIQANKFEFSKIWTKCASNTVELEMWFWKLQTNSKFEWKHSNKSMTHLWVPWKESIPSPQKGNLDEDLSLYTGNALFFKSVSNVAP